MLYLNSMDEKPLKSVDNRNEKGQFGANNNANPEGRPTKTNAWTDILNRILDSEKIEITIVKGDKKEEIKLNNKNTMRYALGVALVKHGLKGNILAIRELFDRTQGKPAQSMDITSDGKRIEGPSIYLPENKRGRTD